MNDILYEFKNLHHFKDSLTFGVKAILVSKDVGCEAFVLLEEQIEMRRIYVTSFFV